MFLTDDELTLNTSPVELPPNSNVEDEPYQLSTAATTRKKLESELAGLVDEMNTQSAQVTDDDYSNVEIPSFEAEKEKPSPAKLKMASTASEFVVKTADSLISRFLASYAHANYKDLSADDADLKEVATYFESYFADSFEMPPWLMGAIAAGYILFDKFKAVAAIRKANLEAEAHKAKVAELEKEIDKLKKEKQIELLKEDVKNLRIVR